MKTLREYIDQLDEISRRDFLKGAGAAAVAGATGARTGIAQAQSIVELANYATAKSEEIVKSYSSVMTSERRAYFLNYVREEIFKQTMWYLNNTNAYNGASVINFSLQNAKQAVDTIRPGIGDMIGGGGLRDNVATKVVSTFVQTYTASIGQKANEYRQTGSQPARSGGSSTSSRPLNDKEMSTLADALLLYAISKEDNHPVHQEISNAIGSFIRERNVKEYVNSIYPKVIESLNVIRPNAQLYQQEKNKMYRWANNTIQDIKQISKQQSNEPEFKESEDLEEASPDAVRRIEELIKYR